MKFFYSFFLFPLCFAAVPNSDPPSTTPVLSSIPRSEYILASLTIAKSAQARYKMNGDFQESNYTKITREQCIDGLYSQTFYEFSWWNIQKDLSALLGPEENTMDDAKKRLMNGLISILRTQRGLAFGTIEPSQKEEIEKYPETEINHYNALYHEITLFNRSGKIDKESLIYWYPFSTELPAVTSIILNLTRVFRFDIPAVPIHYYYDEAENLRNDSKRKLSNLFDNFNIASLDTLIKCIHLTTRGTWYPPETENSISPLFEESIQRQGEGQNKKAQPQNPKKWKKIQPRPQNFVLQEGEFNHQHPILIAHVVNVLKIATKNRLLNQHRYESITPETADLSNPTAHRGKFVTLVYIYVTLEFSWWEIQKDIFALLSPDRNIRMAAKERLTIGLVSIVRRQLSKAFEAMNGFSIGCEIMNEHNRALLQEIYTLSEPNPAIYSSLIHIIKTWISAGSLSTKDFLYYHLYSTEIIAASEIIILLAGVIEFNTPMCDEDYYSVALKLEAESKIGLLKDLKKIDSLDLGLFKKFILKTTKEVWYSKETGIFFSKLCKSELSEEEIKAQELREIEELIIQSQKLKLIETQRQEHEKILLEHKEISLEHKKNKHQRIKEDKTKNVTNEIIETKPETIEVPFGGYPTFENKKEKARLKMEHEVQENSHLKVKNEMQKPKAETSLQKTLKEVMETRNMQESNVDKMRYMVENPNSIHYTAKLSKTQRFVCSHNPLIILDGTQFTILCRLFRFRLGLVEDQDFLKLVQGLRCTEVRVTVGSKRVFIIGEEKCSIHTAHSTGTFDWPRARRLCLYAGFSPHFFNYLGEIKGDLN